MFALTFLLLQIYHSELFSHNLLLFPQIQVFLIIKKAVICQDFYAKFGSTMVRKWHKVGYFIFAPLPPCHYFLIQRHRDVCHRYMRHQDVRHRNMRHRDVRHRDVRHGDVRHRFKTDYELSKICSNTCTSTYRSYCS